MEIPVDNVPEVAPSSDSGIKEKEKKAGQKSKFASIHDYKSAPDDDEEEGQRYVLLIN